MKLLIQSQTSTVWEWINKFISHLIMDVITDPFWIILIKGAPTSLTTTWLCYPANMVQTCYWSRLALVIPGLTHQALMQICSQDSGLHWECCPKNKVIRKCLRVKMFWLRPIYLWAFFGLSFLNWETDFKQLGQNVKMSLCEFEEESDFNWSDKSHLFGL